MVLEFIAMRPHRLRQYHIVLWYCRRRRLQNANTSYPAYSSSAHHRVGSEPTQRAHCVLHCMLWFSPLVLIVTIFPINEWQKTEEVASFSVSAISPLPVTQNEFKHPRSIVFHIKSYFSNRITSTQNEKRILFFFYKLGSLLCAPSERHSWLERNQTKDLMTQDIVVLQQSQNVSAKRNNQTLCSETRPAHQTFTAIKKIQSPWHMFIWLQMMLLIFGNIHHWRGLCVSCELFVFGF